MTSTPCNGHDPHPHHTNAHHGDGHHPNALPTATHAGDDPTPATHPSAFGSSHPNDLVTSPSTVVPIAVWRLAGHDTTHPAPEPDTGFAARLARRLVLIYTRHGDTVIDFDGDDSLHDACRATGRTYLAITDASHIADLDDLPRPITLVMLRWPRPTSTPARVASELSSSPHTEPTGTTKGLDVVDLFTACRLIARADTCVVAAIHTTDTAPFTTHQHTLTPAAHDAGLVHVVTIVAIDTAGTGDHFQYYATATDPAHLTAHGATASGIDTPGDAPDPAAEPVWHVDLMVFTPDSPVDQSPAGRRG